MWVSAPGVRGTEVSLPACPAVLCRGGLGGAVQPRHGVAYATPVKYRGETRNRRAPLLQRLPWEPSSASASGTACDRPSTVNVCMMSVTGGNDNFATGQQRRHSGSRTKRKQSQLCSTIERSSGSVSGGSSSSIALKPTTSHAIADPREIQQSLDGRMETPGATTGGEAETMADENDPETSGKPRSNLQANVVQGRQLLETAASEQGRSPTQPQRLLENRQGGKWRFQKFAAGGGSKASRAPADDIQRSEMKADEGSSQPAEAQARVTAPSNTDDQDKPWPSQEHTGLNRASTVKVGAAMGGDDPEEGEGSEGIWSPRKALARVCEREPRLIGAIEAFETKCPGAVLIFVAYAGSLLYGTATANSDIDIKGVFIPGPQRVGEKPNERNLKGKLIPEPMRPAKFDADFPMERIFHYSTSSANVTNTQEDIDVEFMSIDSFLAKLLRAQVNAMETLFSMMTPHASLLEDPQIVPLLVSERRHLVTRHIGSWVGYTRMHLEKFRKLYDKETAADKDMRPVDGEEGDTPDSGELVSITPMKIAEAHANDVAGTRSRGGEGDAVDTEAAQRSDDEQKAYELRRSRTGKVLSHARRAIVQAEELFRTGEITFPLAPNHIEEVTRLKSERSFQHSTAAAVRVKIELMQSTALKSHLPNRVNKRKLVSLRDEILWRHHMRHEKRNKKLKRNEKVVASE